MARQLPTIPSPEEGEESAETSWQIRLSAALANISKVRSLESELHEDGWKQITPGLWEKDGIRANFD